jgi:hypothetical protein
MTAWSRELYPDVFFGGVGSSGVVNALVDYTGYTNVVLEVISNYTNPSTNINCGQTMKEAMSNVSSMMTSANGRQQLFKGFKTCQPLDPNNQNLLINFYTDLATACDGDVQYGQYKTGCCRYLTDTSHGATSLARLQSLVAYENGGASCLDIDYNDMISEIKADSEYVLWFYQTCNEFGWYQTTDGTENNNFFGNVSPVWWWVQQCQDVFGNNYNNASVYANAARTNAQRGGQLGYNGTMIVLPNGSWDPWHLVAVLTQNNPGQTLVLLEGGSHCSDMYGDKDSDPPQWKQAKMTIKNTVIGWFNN